MKYATYETIQGKYCIWGNGKTPRQSRKDAQENVRCWVTSSKDKVGKLHTIKCSEALSQAVDNYGAEPGYVCEQEVKIRKGTMCLQAELSSKNTKISDLIFKFCRDYIDKDIDFDSEAYKDLCTLIKKCNNARQKE